MVGENCDAYRLVPGAYLIEDRLDESLIEVLDSLQLQFQIAIMTRLVARLYVNIYEVVAILQCLDSCGCLALIVGIGKTRSALNDDVAQTGVMADASDQVYGRNHGTLLDLWIHLGEGEHVRTVTAAPRPDKIGHSFATLLARHIERMVLQEFLTLENQLVQKVGCITTADVTLIASNLRQDRFHHQLIPFLVGMIMRWGTVDMLVSVLHHQKMAILDAGNKLDIRIFLAEGIVEILDEHIRIFRFQVTTVVGDNLAVLHIDDVAAQGKVGRLQFIADAGSLQRSASFVNLVLVIAHDRAVGYLRTRMESIWHGNESSCLALLGKHIHIGFVGVLQESFSTQSFYRVVSHSVAKNDNMFHLFF